MNETLWTIIVWVLWTLLILLGFFIEALTRRNPDRNSWRRTTGASRAVETGNPLAFSENHEVQEPVKWWT